jgi:hypothetical protein
MANWLTGAPGRARFHRTFVIRVSHGGRGGFVSVGSGAGDELELPGSDEEAVTLDVLDRGLDFIRAKTGRRVVSVFLSEEDDNGDRWYAVVTSPTL